MYVSSSGHRFPKFVTKETAASAVFFHRTTKNPPAPQHNRPKNPPAGQKHTKHQSTIGKESTSCWIPKCREMPSDMSETSEIMLVFSLHTRKEREQTFPRRPDLFHRRAALSRRSEIFSAHKTSKNLPSNLQSKLPEHAHKPSSATAEICATQAINSF